MRKTRPETPQVSSQNRVLSEPGEHFGLTEHVGEAGTLCLPPAPGPSFVIVLEGRVGHAPRAQLAGQSYSGGEGFCVWQPQPLRLFGSARVWQVTGRAELIGALGRFSAQLVRKDAETAAHAARVGGLTAAMGRSLGLPSPRLERLALAAYLHDLGKIGLPTALLQAPTPLTLPQWRLMACHPYEGGRLLEGTPLAFARAVAEQHHERLNGSGYPAGLRGEAITLEGQLVAVADTFDAITHGRPYQEARGPQQALSELNRYSGVLFSREAVGALNTVIKPKLA